MRRWRRSPGRAPRQRGGTGRVVFVTGEPGIGKTSLVTRFLRDLDAGARVLVGTCDDLSIPRPLGPIRDLVGSVSPALEEALAAGAAPHDIQSLLIAELELPPRPTVLVLEDVHWADDATLRLDHGARAPDRLAAGAARPDLPRRRGAAGPPASQRPSARSAPTTRSSSSSRRSRRAPSPSLAGDDADEVYAATGGNPFYVTELLALAGVRRAAALGRERGARTRVAARRRRAPRSSSWSRSCRAACARRCSTP